MNEGIKYSSLQDAIERLPNEIAWSITYERERELSGKPPYCAQIRAPYWTSYSNCYHEWGDTPSEALNIVINKALEIEE